VGSLVRHDTRDAAGGGPWSRAAAGSHDGWIGTRELPGYRAGAVIAKLAELPGVGPGQLYLDVLRLDGEGHAEDSCSGACPAMRRDDALDDRSRFVRVVAELLRHAAAEPRGLAGLGVAIGLLREHGIQAPQLAIAAQRLDAVCSEEALVASLCDMLVLSVGEEEAVRTLAAMLARLLPHADAGSELADQVGLLVRCVGRAQARRQLREAIDFPLLPTAELLGL
jgi:hypothetical protein